MIISARKDVNISEIMAWLFDHDFKIAIQTSHCGPKCCIIWSKGLTTPVAVEFHESDLETAMLFKLAWG